MSNVGELERIAQNRIVKLLVDRLGYKNLGDWHERAGNSQIEENLLRDYLTGQGFSENLISLIHSDSWRGYNGPGS
jgi:type I restriction enzyme R subunit